MSKDKKEQDGTTINLAQALEQDGNDAVFPDSDPLDNESDADPEPYSEEDPDEETIPVSQLDTQDKPDEPDKPEEKGKKDKKDWDQKRQERDEARAKREEARDSEVTELREQLGTMAETIGTMSEKMTSGNQALLAKLVDKAGGGTGDDDTSSATVDDLTAAIKGLDPENAEFPDLIKAITSLANEVTDGKAQRAALQKALSDQDKRLKDEHATQTERHDKRDARDLDDAAHRSVAEHLDSVMAKGFKDNAMRKEVQTRALKLIADAGYQKDERVETRVAKMALSTAGRELAAELAAKRKGDEDVPTDDFRGASFAEEVTGKHHQTMPEAVESMGPRAR